MPSDATTIEGHRFRTPSRCCRLRDEAISKVSVTRSKDSDGFPNNLRAFVHDAPSEIRKEIHRMTAILEADSRGIRRDPYA